MVTRAGINYLQLDESRDPKETAQVFGEVSRALDRACDTSKQLLAFARPRPEDVGTCFPADVIKHFAASVRRMLPEAIRVEIDPVPTAAVPLSSSALEQVLLNLTISHRATVARGSFATHSTR